AVQDAVAAANILWKPLRSGQIEESNLRQVQRRRLFPTRLTQRAQVFIQNNIIAGVLGTAEALAPPLPLKLLERFPFLRRIPARLMGMGVRPEHVTSREASASLWRPPPILSCQATACGCGCGCSHSMTLRAI